MWWIEWAPHPPANDDAYVAGLEHEVILGRLVIYFRTQAGIDISSMEAPLYARMDFPGGTNREFLLACNSHDFDIAPHLDFILRVLVDTRSAWTIVLMDWTSEPEREMARYRKPIKD